jgi:methyl-accepting chemotaxis protein
MAEPKSFPNRVRRLVPAPAVTLGIRSKVLLSLLALALIPLIVLGAVGYFTAGNTLNAEAFRALEAVRELKEAGIARLLTVWRVDVEDVSSDPSAIDGVVRMAAGFRELGPERLRALYLGKQELTDAGDGSDYTASHFEQSQFYPFYLPIHGYHDVLLVDPAGNVVYTWTKRPVYATNLEAGRYRETNLATVFRQLKGAPPERTFISEAAEVDGEVAIFVGSPVWSYDDELNPVRFEGALIYQAPFAQVNAIMQETAGLGATGDSYLVGGDGRWRSDSRFEERRARGGRILAPEMTMATPAIRSALAGDEGTDVIEDYRGVEVLSSWSPLVVEPSEEVGTTWALAAETELAEVQAPVRRLALFTALVVLAAVILVVAAAFVLSGGLVRQIRAIGDLFDQIGAGNLEARAPVISRDELGAMAASLNSMLDNTLTLIQSREERDRIQGSIRKLLDEVSGVAEGDLSGEAEVTPDVTGAIADSFNVMIGELRRIIGEVRDTTLQVSSSASEIQTTTEHLAQGSEQQALQILDTTAAVDEMAVSVQQVSETSAQAAAVAEQALANAKTGAESVDKTIQGMNAIRGQVQETSRRIKRLGESSQEIGEIVQLIGDIADRTSILALNASIQAAMAGEAGRGFAVVAEEVERLAERSAEATKRIGTLIKSVQGETVEAVSAMEATTREVVSGSALANDAGRTLGEIESVSNRLSELIQSISLASKQQARGSESVAKSMSEISEVTQQTSAGTKQAAVAIRNLAELADELRESLDRFRLPQRRAAA